MGSRDLDFIIFGASGFTGKNVVVKAVSMLNGFKWGIAGRNKEKLETVLRETSEKFKEQSLNIPLFIADVNDYDSLVNLTKNCKV